MWFPDATTCLTWRAKKHDVSDNVCAGADNLRKACARALKCQSLFSYNGVNFQTYFFCL